MDSDASGGGVLDYTQRILKSFILAYKDLPELWDPRDDHYTNKYRRVAAQDKLLTILKKLQSDATRLDVRKKINTLRSNYNKKMSKIREAEAEGNKYVNRNWMFDELRFLDAIKKPECQNESNEVETDDGGDYGETEMVCETEIATNMIKDEKTYMTPATMSFVKIDDRPLVVKEDSGSLQPTLTDQPKSAKRAISTKTNFKVKKLRKHHQRVTGSLHPQASSSMGIDPIALVWSSKLSTLRQSQRILAEKAINDILFEASMNNLRQGPMMVNTGMCAVTPIDSEGFNVEVPEEYIEYTSTEGDDDQG